MRDRAGGPRLRPHVFGAGSGTPAPDPHSLASAVRSPIRTTTNSADLTGATPTRQTSRPASRSAWVTVAGSPPVPPVTTVAVDCNGADYPCRIGRRQLRPAGHLLAPGQVSRRAAVGG